jgi:hypothetical protein
MKTEIKVVFIGVQQMRAGTRTLLLAALVAFLPPVLSARGGDEAPAPVLRFEGHAFSPRELVVPAGSRLRLRIVNAGTDAIEFESLALNRERVVPPGEAVVLYLPALDRGAYGFVDDFHREAGEGTITAR